MTGGEPDRLAELLAISTAIDGTPLADWVTDAAYRDPSSAIRACALAVLAENLYLGTDQQALDDIFDLLGRSEREFALTELTDELVPFRWIWFRTRLLALSRADDRPAEVEQAVRDAYAFARDHDYEPGIRVGKTNLGLQAAHVGRPIEALLHFVDVLNIMPPNRTFEGYAHRGIGRLLAGAALHPDAVAQLELSDSCLSGQTGAPQRIPGLADLGISAVEMGDLDRAERAMVEIDDLAAATPETDFTSRASGRIVEAKLWIGRGQPGRALDLLERHRALIKSGLPLWFWHPAQIEAEALLADGDATAALALASEEHNLLHVQMPHQYELLAECHAARGEWEVATTCQREAQDRRRVYVFDPGVFLSVGRTRLTDLEAQVGELAETSSRTGSLIAQRDEMLSHIAHEIRNPLAALLGCLEVVRAGGDLSVDPLSLMRTLVERMHQSTNALLEAASTMSDPAQPRVEIDVVSAEVAALFVPAAAEKGSQIVADDLVRADASCRPGSLRLAVSNLLSNALKFSPPGSRIELCGGIDDEHAVVSVLDEGPGFTDADLELAFRHGARLSAVPTAGEPSTGVGLSLVKKSIESCGGQVTIANRPEGGAAVSIHLPIATGVAA